MNLRVTRQGHCWLVAYKRTRPLIDMGEPKSSIESGAWQATRAQQASGWTHARR